jgi:hypothetical protein
MRQTVRVILNRQESGKELLPLGWERELTLTYVPAAHLEAALAGAPPFCGIAFVRLANIPRGFLVAHEGFLLDRRCLLHASTESGRVALVDVLDYVFKRRDSDSAGEGTGGGGNSARDAGSGRSAGGARPRFDGAIFYAFREGAALRP